MYIIGKANDKEIAEMMEMDFDVEPVDEACFNAAMNRDENHDPKHKANQPEAKEDYPDKFVAIFLDCNILDQLSIITRGE